MRWHNKPTATAGLTNLLERWHSARKVRSTEASAPESNASSFESPSLRTATAGDDERNLSLDKMYEFASVLAGMEMQDGDAFDACDSARIAFPVVWENARRPTSARL